MHQKAPNITSAVMHTPTGKSCIQITESPTPTSFEELKFLKIQIKDIALLRFEKGTYFHFEWTQTRSGNCVLTVWRSPLSTEQVKKCPVRYGWLDLKLFLEQEYWGSKKRALVLFLWATLGAKVLKLTRINEDVVFINKEIIIYIFSDGYKLYKIDEELFYGSRRQLSQSFVWLRTL